MAYYDKIAQKWHKQTGYKGGAFKELILNEKVISHIGNLSGKSILELGIGNGYFMPMVLRKKSGQIPEQLFLTDNSIKNLEIAQKHFKIKNGKYKLLDVYRKFGIPDNSIDLIISNMMFNEIDLGGLQNGFQECHNILKKGGEFIISTLHPQFIEFQKERGVIKEDLMPSKNGLKLPAVSRNVKDYFQILDHLDFDYESEDVFGSKKLYNSKPKLKVIKDTPIALLLHGRK